MRLGVLLPRHPGAIAEAARTAEAVGFDSVWVAESYNRGFMLPDPFVALGIAAAVTERVELGTSVVQVPLRPPFHFASQVASVATASGGRLVLGVGAGSRVDDYVAMGADFDARFRSLDASLGIVRRLLSGEEVDGARLNPWEDLPDVPILVGAWASERWVRKAGTELDGWIASAHATDLDKMIDGLKRFREHGGSKRAIAANLIAKRPEAAELVAGLAEAGFDDVAISVDQHDAATLERARDLWPL